MSQFSEVSVSKHCYLFAYGLDASSNTGGHTFKFDAHIIDHNLNAHPYGPWVVKAINNVPFSIIVQPGSAFGIQGPYQELDTIQFYTYPQLEKCQTEFALIPSYGGHPPSFQWTVDFHFMFVFDDDNETKLYSERITKDFKPGDLNIPRGRSLGALKPHPPT